MSSEGAAPRSAPARPRFWWVRWTLLGIIVAVLAVEVYLIWPRLEETWWRIDELKWQWIIACIVAALLSMDSFAQVQRALLRSAGVRVRQGSRCR